MASKYKYTKNSISKRRKKIDELKSKPCGRCGISYPPYVMDWHHLDPSTKEFSIGEAAFRRGLQQLLKEISKCQLLCANCHRIVEHELKEKKKIEEDKQQS